MFMKKIIIYIFLLINSITIFSQETKINWILFIDGKIPQSIILRGEFICFENTPMEKIIPFEYLIGDIKISENDMRYIEENGGNMEFIRVKLTYKEFAKHSHNEYIYSFEIEPRLLLPIYDYVVLRITNLNKKKGTFYFGYSTSYESTPLLKNEYPIFSKIITDVPKKGVKTEKIQMKRINFTD